MVTAIEGPIGGMTECSVHAGEWPRVALRHQQRLRPFGHRVALTTVSVVDLLAPAQAFGVGGHHVQKELNADVGVIFCSIPEAVREHPDLVQKYLRDGGAGSDNFFAALNSAVFSDGSASCSCPKGVRCPMELSTYFRINARWIPASSSAR